MKKNIVIIHYNTPDLTEALIKSINKYVENAIIYIFDNSDKFPFIAKFDNVTIIDNTKGQIINFDEWLKKYPNRFKSSEATKMFGSAKHCYSIEKCIEIINENFILLDSDVLIKKDISNLYDEKVAYIGEIIKQPSVTIKRVLPFLCFINVDMLKKHGKHYFYDNYMHGLYNNRINRHADWYDTGAGFYANTLNLPHYEINCNDYVVHYGHGSWDKKGHEHVMSKEEWLLHNKKYWSDKQNKKVIYTCITGGYDSIIEPTKITEDFDYICFTDDKTLTSDVWEIRELPEEVKDLSIVKKQRYIKINAHKVLPGYELSVWVDGNVVVQNDLNTLLEKYVNDKNDISIFVPKHPIRCCIYAESKACISMKKDTAGNINPQIERFKKEGFPEKYGLLQSNIMIRKHMDKDCIKLMEDWFNVLKDGSHRDQLSFNYVCWKNQNIKVLYLPATICYSNWFKWKSGHAKNKKNDVNTIKEKIVNNNYKNKLDTEAIKEKIEENKNRINGYKKKLQIRYL